MSAIPRTSVALADLAHICRLGRLSDPLEPRALSTGFAELDAALPFGGWPLGAVTEILPRREGSGELQLVMPVLARLSREPRQIAFIAPPHLPYPPALAQHGLMLEQIVIIYPPSIPLSLWAAEQVLRCRAFGAMLVWPVNIDDRALRRLQLAAEAARNLAIVYRPFSAARFSSPAALRLCLGASDVGVQIEIKKCRGGRAGKIVHCQCGADLPASRVA